MSREKTKILLQILGLIAVVSVAFYLAYLSRDSIWIRSIVESYGYLGVFVLAFFSGFNLIVPVPAIAFMPLMLESGLNFWLAVVVIMAGMSIADSISFFIGKAAKELTRRGSNRIIDGLRRAKRTNELFLLIILFLFVAVVPLPSEILLVPLGFMNYNFMRVWPILLVGNLTFNIIYSLGLVTLFKTLFA